MSEKYAGLKRDGSNMKKSLETTKQIKPSSLIGKCVRLRIKGHFGKMSRVASVKLDTQDLTFIKRTEKTCGNGQRRSSEPGSWSQLKTISKNGINDLRMHALK